MMKIFLSVLVLLTAMGLDAKETSWKKLDREELGGYTRSDYHLRIDVQCLEIRTYFVDKKNKIDRDYWGGPITWCVRPFKSIDPKLMKNFRKAKPNLSRNGDIGKREAGRISNAFVLGTRNKMWRMNMAEDVIRYLGDVDSLAEARLVLWLYGKENPYRYRKTSKGYEFLIAYTKSTAGCQKCNPNEVCIEDKAIKEKAIVDKKGNIVLFKQLKSKIVKQECIERIHK